MQGNSGMLLFGLEAIWIDSINILNEANRRASFFSIFFFMIVGWLLLCVSVAKSKLQMT